MTDSWAPGDKVLATLILVPGFLSTHHLSLSKSQSLPRREEGLCIQSAHMASWPAPWLAQGPRRVLVC